MRSQKPTVQEVSEQSGVTSRVVQGERSAIVSARAKVTVCS